VRQPWALLISLSLFVNLASRRYAKPLSCWRCSEAPSLPLGPKAIGGVLTLRLICVAATLSKSEPSNQASRAHGESSAEGPASSSGVGATPSSSVGDAPIGWCASKRSLCRARAPTDVHDLAKHGDPFIFAHHHPCECRQVFWPHCLQANSSEQRNTRRVLEGVMESMQARAGVPGPEPLTVQRQEFARLIAKGVSNSEACRLVGVNRRTGTRWRYGRTVTFKSGAELQYPPMAITRTTCLSARFLSEDERVLIADRVRAGTSLRAIGRELGRPASTVSREVRRNRDDGGRYRPFTAQQMAVRRLVRPKERRLASDPVLRNKVQGWLDLRWSPEQIAHTLRLQYPDNTAWHLVHESIYQAFYAKDGTLGRDRYTCLRTRRRRRPPRRSPDARRAGTLRDMTMIGARPADIEDRAIPGHWEGDLITGAANGSAIGTLVERSTRYVLLVHVPKNHTAEATRDGVLSVMGKLPADLRRSLTWDQGKEMADHLQINTAMGMSVYFCEPHSPWQRGTNENSNGLLRDYFPKSTNLAVHSAERLTQVQDELNNRPRKTLGWQSPAGALARLQFQYS
jgi:IS30 family transposase